MDGMMYVAQMQEKQKVEIVQRPIPQLQKGEVLIQIDCCGICGSDIHYFQEARIGDVAVETPFVLGHEVAGTIVELTAGVTGFQIGDRVAIEAGVPCGTCVHCRTGHYNLCPHMQFLATPPYDGAMSQYMAYPAQWLFKLPDTMSAVEGALIEPLAVGIHATEMIVKF